MTPLLARVQPGRLLGAAGLPIAVEVAVAGHHRGPLVTNILLCACIGLPLAWASRRPVAAAAGALALHVLQCAVQTPTDRFVTPLVLVVLAPYVVARHAAGARVLAGLALCAALGACARLVTPAAERGNAAWWPLALIVLAAAGAGALARRQALRVAELERLAAELAALQRDRERLAVAEERAHVARELHDVVAHAMTVVCLQAAAARRVWDARPAEARSAVRAIHGVAHDALAHLSGALPLLGGEAGSARLEQAELEVLAASARGAGLDVAVEVAGRPRPLPGDVGLVAFRVVQEALTNAARHAAPSAVRVRLDYRAAELSVEVRDAGRAPVPRPAVAPPTGSGRGLIGMRERVEACAGGLECGPEPGGGFAVRARLPLAQVAA